MDSCSTLIHILARYLLKSHARDVIRLALRLVDEETEMDGVSKVFRSLIKSYNPYGSASFVISTLISEVSSRRGASNEYTLNREVFCFDDNIVDETKEFIVKIKNMHFQFDDGEFL
ncbi:unnamed protein product [Arabis nemorensis]|uniref:Uncharacterized protein n=1 Tax=Arabis nemorensis TaxID=586526 RepID=A0A565ASW4_9BRAS|nr:unnamed protein product [Arabis nemorensis]